MISWSPWSALPSRVIAPAMLVVGASGLLLAACEDDESAQAAPQPTGPPSFVLDEPLDGSCVVLREPGATLRARLTTTHWNLRPQGTCGLLPQCGVAVYFVDGIEVLRTASLVSEVPMEKVPAISGSHVLRVELRAEGLDDEAALDADGDPLAVEVSLRTVDPGGSCEDAGIPDSGVPDADPDAAADADDGDVTTDAPDDADAADAPEAEDDAALDADDAAVDAPADGPDEATDASSEA